MKRYLAIDIGGTFIKYGIYTKDGIEINKDKKSTPKNPEEFLDALLSIVKDIENDIKIEGIGISCPGFINPKTGENTDYSIGENIKKYNIKEEINKRTGYNVAIENDAKCAILAENWLGAGKDCNNFLVITLGTGVGGGIILNNELYRGHNFKAGEFGLGYIGFDVEEENISTKTPPSAQVLARRVSKAIGKDVDGEYIFNNLEDSTIKGIYKQWLVEVSILLNNLTLYLDPEKILIGGGISASKNLIPDLKNTLNKLNNNILDTMDIEPCLFRNDSGKIGALYNYIKEYES